MAIRKTNLNLLRILSVLLHEPNLSRASEILGLSQPTLSSALKQLRDEFNDPLLVRVGNKMELTNKALSLVGPLEGIFKAVDMLWEVEASNPEEVRRHILIGTTDYGTALFAPSLANVLAERAPRISLQFVDVAETRRLINRESDLDFYLVPDAICNSPAFQDFKYMPLFDEEMVYMVSRTHRLAAMKTIHEGEIEKERFTLYNLGDERSSLLTRRAIAAMELERNVVLRVQQFSLLPLIAEETDTVVILPRGLAEKLQDKFNCRILGPIVPEFPFAFCLMWDSVHHTDPVHEYLRDIFREFYKTGS